jgi:hypothetical protein
MKYILSILSITAIGCSLFVGNSKKQALGYSKVGVTYLLPTRVKPDLVDVAKVQFSIIYADDYRLYEFKSRKTMGEAIDDTVRLVKDTVINEYFVYKLGNTHGFHLMQLTDSFLNRQRVDSFLTARALYTIRVDAIKTHASLVRTFYSNDDMVEVYNPEKNNGIDSVYFYYNKSKRDIAFSLSQKLDSQYQSKLYKMMVLTPRDTTAYADYANKYRWISIELGSQPIDNKVKLDSFLTRFKKETPQQ